MTPAQLIAAMETTWPAAARRALGPVTLRDGQGGGKRVSAATIAGDFTQADLDAAQDAMRQMGQVPLFQVLPGQDRLDLALADRGYGLRDPVMGFAAPAALLARPHPPLAAFPHWPPLQVACDIWAEAGIGPARLAVMHRVTGPKSVILARSQDRPAGAAFVALSGTDAMLHALEIRPDLRRQGAAGHVIAAAAAWALTQGAQRFGLVVTLANTPARALYEALGMQPVAGYHYREHHS